MHCRYIGICGVQSTNGSCCTLLLSLLIFTFVVPWVREGKIGHSLAVSLDIPSKPSRVVAILCSMLLPLLWFHGPGRGRSGVYLAVSFDIPPKRSRKAAIPYSFSFYFYSFMDGEGAERV